MAMDYSYSIGGTTAAVGDAVSTTGTASCQSGSGECGWIRMEIEVNGYLVGYKLTETLRGGDTASVSPGDRYYSRSVGSPPAIFTDTDEYHVEGGELVFDKQGEYNVDFTFENINTSAPAENYGGTVVVSDPQDPDPVPQVEVASCVGSQTTTAGDPVTVSVSLSNSGGADGSGSVNIFDQNGLVTGEYTATVPANGTKTVDFEVVYDTPGEYNLEAEYESR